jgi:hypothetical protein
MTIDPDGATFWYMGQYSKDTGTTNGRWGNYIQSFSFAGCDGSGGGTGTTPGPATGPSPADGATGVLVDADLSWSAGGNATSHKVYFGTSVPLGLVASQSGTTYDPGTMQQGTTYLWRVDEVNGGITTTGTEWSFTTETGSSPIPGKATNPSPASPSTDVAIDVVLSWTAGSDTDSHDVYFGNCGGALTLEGNQSGTTFAPLGLANNTNYCWRIDELNNGGTKTTGDEWSFTTVAATGGSTLVASSVNNGKTWAAIVTDTGGAALSGTWLYSGGTPSCTDNVCTLEGIPKKEASVDFETASETITVLKP